MNVAEIKLIHSEDQMKTFNVEIETEMGNAFQLVTHLEIN